MLRLDDVMLCRLGLAGSDSGIHIGDFGILCTKVWLMCIPWGTAVGDTFL